MYVNVFLEFIIWMSQIWPQKQCYALSWCVTADLFSKRRKRYEDVLTPGLMLTLGNT